MLDIVYQNRPLFTACCCHCTLQPVLSKQSFCLWPHKHSILMALSTLCWLLCNSLITKRGWACFPCCYWICPFVKSIHVPRQFYFFIIPLCSRAQNSHDYVWQMSSWANTVQSFWTELWKCSPSGRELRLFVSVSGLPGALLAVRLLHTAAPPWKVPTVLLFHSTLLPRRPLSWFIAWCWSFYCSRVYVRQIFETFYLTHNCSHLWGTGWYFDVCITVMIRSG